MNESGKLSIAHWAEKHEVPPIVAVAAQHLAVMADGVCDILEGFRTGELEQHFPERPSVEQWLGLYREHRGMFRALVDRVPIVPGSHSHEELERVWDFVNALAKDVPGARNEFEDELRSLGEEQLRKLVSEGSEQVRRWQEGCLKEMQAYLQGEDDAAEDDVDDFRSLLGDSPEIHFFTRVTLPCLAAYETFPLRLLRRARNGDVLAIERIVRLDAMTIHDPKIAAWVHGGTDLPRRAREDDAAKWMREGLSKPLERRQLKYVFAGLMSWLSEVVGRRLTARAIRELFDAATEDREEVAGLPDPDIPQSIETFQKAIQRYRKPWRIELALRVDKERSV